MNGQEILKAIIFYLIVVLLFGPVYFFGQIFFNNLEEFFVWRAALSHGVFPSGVVPELTKEPDEKNFLVRRTGIEQPEINAKSALSIEIGTSGQKVLFEKNKDEKLPIASLTKMMTALIVFENYKLSYKTEITKATVLQEGGQGNLKEEDVLSVKDLLYIMLIESSNDAAFALSEIAGPEKFISFMNFQAEKIGLKNSYFADASGLSSESYSTANDLATLMKYLLKKYPLSGEIISLKEFDLYLDNGQLHHKLINTNTLLGEMPEIIGGKTGWTNEARGCFFVIEKSPKDGNYLIHIILGTEDRVGEMKKLIDWVRAQNTNQNQL